MTKQNRAAPSDRAGESGPVAPASVSRRLGATCVPRQLASATSPLPTVPDRLFFRIGEVARLCDVPAYVLRFWESEFPMLRPGKAGTGQRLFRRRDAEMAVRIRHLLYEQGYTIQGARQLLRSEARTESRSRDAGSAADTALPAARREQLHQLRSDLQSLYRMLSAAPPVSAPLTPPIRARRSTGAPQRPSLFAALEAESSAEPHTAADGPPKPL